MATTDFTGTADLARRRYELAKGRSESNLAQKLGNIGRQYYGLARQQEAGLEGRGILRSGEAGRRRVELGAEEKAARLAESQAAEQDIQSAALDYASVLAEIQAKQGTTTTPPPKEPEPIPKPPAAGGGPATTPTPAPAPTPPAGGGGAPATQPTVIDCGPGYYYDPVQRVCVPISSGGPVQPGMPSLAPGQGGINEIGSGGLPFGTPPTQGPTVGGITVPSGQTPSETRGVAPTVVAPGVTVNSNGTTTIVGPQGPVTMTPAQWNQVFAGMAAAAQPVTPAPAPPQQFFRPGGLRYQ